MVEIKFRGKHLKSEKWLFGNLVIREFPSITDYSIINREMAFPIKKETTGQFIGLTDKNGVEIYEGDIIKTKRGDWGVIVRKDHCFETTVSENQSSFYTKEYYNSSEIIGNIHDNPELLSTPTAVL